VLCPNEVALKRDRIDVRFGSRGVRWSDFNGILI
jgi:hypothetical protein